jgi:hypothetical protein
MQWFTSVLSSSKDGHLAALLGGSSANVSGGETRDDGIVACGFSLMRGKRPHMEDYHHAEVSQGLPLV